MGLFDSETEHYVSTSVQRVVEDKLLPDSVKSGTIKSIFNGDDIGLTLIEELIQGVGVKVERMYAYARDHYTYGLPSGKIYAANQGTAEVTAVLETLEGGPVLLEYARFGAFNLMHAGWTMLIADHGYNPATNQLGVLSTQKGHPVYLKDMQVVFPPGEMVKMIGSALEEWSLSPTAGYTPERQAQITEGTQKAAKRTVFIEDPLATTVHLRVVATWETVTYGFGSLFPNSSGRYPTEIFTLAIPAHDPESDFFHAKYTVNGVLKHWRYEVGAETYPTLDALFDDPPDTAGEYFPLLYFRFKKQSMELKEGTEEYTTSQKMAKYLGINYADMIAGIHENPGIEDVEQAMMMLGANPNSTDPLELRYLFDYFNEQYFYQNPDQGTVIGDHIKAQVAFSLIGQRNTTVVKDTRFKMSLSNNGIYRKIVPGVIGAKGSYAGGIRTVSFDYTTTDPEGIEQVRTSSYKEHYYRRQTTETMYEEVYVRSLSLRYHVYGKYSTLGRGTNAILLVPLDRSIVKNYPLPVREKLYARCLHYVFNSHVEVEVEWYEQEWFQVVMVVAAVVITVISLGSMGPAMAAYMAAIAAGTVTAMAVLIGVLMTYILPYLAMMVAVKLFVKAVGAEAAFIVAVLATVAGMYGSMGMTTASTAPMAQDLLTISTNLVSEISETIQEAFLDLQADQTEFSLYVEKQLETLSTANALLEQQTLLSPITIFGEKPDDFYNRTVHSGNIGQVGISAIGSFVDVALTLPTFNETLGEI